MSTRSIPSSRPVPRAELKQEQSVKGGRSDDRRTGNRPPRGLPAARDRTTASSTSQAIARLVDDGCRRDVTIRAHVTVLLSDRRPLSRSAAVRSLVLPGNWRTVGGAYESAAGNPRCARASGARVGADTWVRGSRWIRERTEGVLSVDYAPLYKALHRLERAGCVSALWGISDNGRRARFYKLTTAGRQRLRDEESAWRRYAGAMSRVLEPA